MKAAPVPICEPAIFDRPPRRRERFAAIATTCVLIVMTIVSVSFGTGKGAYSAPFLPICITLCVAADLLTCYFLLSQFSRTGTAAFLFIGSAYALSGLLSIAYLAFFPGMFLPLQLPVGDQQLSVSLWAVWHAIFSLLIGTYMVVDPSFKAQFSFHVRPGVLKTAMLAIIGSAIAIVAAVFYSRSTLPIFVLQGHFHPVFSYVAIAIFALSACVVLVGLARTRTRTPFQYWLLLAVLVCGLDALLNSFAPNRYTLSWYFGKIETLLTSIIVLAAMLGEVASLYKRLSDVSMLDPLTGIHNRRGLDEMFQYAVDTARRHDTPFGLLVIDIDHFKLYNDRYGHAAGDVVLRQVASVLSTSLMRSTDTLARYGGEEFVVLLPAANEAAAVRIGEHLRAQVELQRIPHAGSSFANVTVSIGATGGLVHRDMTPATLFDLADAALYQAKAHGRNRVEAFRHTITTVGNAA